MHELDPFLIEISDFLALMTFNSSDKLIVWDTLYGQENVQKFALKNSEFEGSMWAMSKFKSWK